jgi:hypothetical protein
MRSDKCFLLLFPTFAVVVGLVRDAYSDDLDNLSAIGAKFSNGDSSAIMLDKGPACSADTLYTMSFSMEQFMLYPSMLL